MDQVSKKQPGPADKEQYDSLLSGTDSESVDLDAIDAWSRRRRWGRVPLLIIPALLLFCAGVTLVAIESSNVSRMNTLFSQLHHKLDMLDRHAHSSVPVQVPVPAAPKAAPPTGDEFGHCGASIAEARSLGCIFDPMSWAWQRPECYHPELVADFLARMDWRFYLSKQALPSEEVSREAWIRGDYLTLYGPGTWHTFHCTYSWRKFHEAFKDKKPMDNDILQIQHTMHCDTVFLHDLDPKLTAACDTSPGGCNTTEVNAGFNSCGWY
ncbi:acetylserotonin methytransferase-like protein [Purpureocillium lavendulum]|uniref:Acetylserotonin methytransferase-like protein n=1 Tax=Purpureocillium lavendulum TaxID=1247861 RepID=A0AB34FV09_9HYPO|nr:acetylserotonin methytransferase-like protein [Purpureocillium lavendulum]